MYLVVKVSNCHLIETVNHCPYIYKCLIRESGQWICNSEVTCIVRKETDYKLSEEKLVNSLP